ncbi:MULTISPECIES: polysaccharide deacetylase family protein [unclassified Pedobacter]|uniref:polysaccharide deacetylase family protein n=1 Tax=unclassified Pedobacter TaxID=2628915 RepID=UPI001420FE97|nr:MULTISPECIES: polysaccharide deacetylase family protein [unclassified Pedobacter]NII81314.1 peptidoglycan/xylan/chitin deacetylase (PgdA/CDA1 family) [Pedobacter sp. SG908]NMN35320.1 peptidoglycan/xylan/chitin deacetylase (PgdA/CDA1 family) [Pedobacter sp. SG918]
MPVPIIMLHHVNDFPDPGIADWSINTEKFKLLLDIIERKGLKTTTFEEIGERNGAIHQKSVILSFDDCPATLFEFAVPELLKRNMKAVFSIPTAQIGGYNSWDVAEQGFSKIALITAAQLQYLSSKGMEIASHGQHHLRASQISTENFIKEISASKTIIETLIDKKVHTFTFPYGDVPKNYRQLLRLSGYGYGLSIYQAKESNFALRRIGIHQSDTAKSISFKLSQSYQLMRALFDPLLSLQFFLRLKAAYFPFLFIQVYDLFNGKKMISLF